MCPSPRRTKRPATAAGIGFTELSNGFATCEYPAALQAICDRLGPGTIEVFFQRWLARLPLTDADRAAGYWWELSMRQVEVSRTLVFTAPRHARSFFETLVADNLGTGRPDEISLILDRRIRSDTEGGFATRVVTRGVDVTVTSSTNTPGSNSTSTTARHYASRPSSTHPPTSG